MEKGSEKTNNALLPTGVNPTTAPTSGKAPYTTVDIPLRPTFSQSCWKRRTFLEKALFLVLVVMTVVVIATVIIASTWPRGANVCLTEECIRTSARIIDAMDRSVDPCEDFFEHACGTWNRKHTIPDDKSNYNTFRKLGDELQAQLKVLVEEPLTKNDSQAIKNVKYLYQSCMNISLIEARQERPLLALIEELGGWPVADRNWTEQTFDFEQQMAKFRLVKSSGIIHHWVGPDDKRSDVNIILLDQPMLGMANREYYLKSRDDRVLRAYENMAINFSKALGAEPAEAERQMKDVIDFEIKLANLTVPEEYRRDTEAIYNKLRIADLSSIMKGFNFNWLKYMNAVYGNVSIQVSETEEVLLYSTKYLEQLGFLLNVTAKRTLANYLVWNLIISRIPLLPQKIHDLKRNFNKAYQGTDQEQARWRSCVSYVNENLGMAVGRLFVEKHFDEEAKANAVEMIDHVKNAFFELLDEIDWMDKDTKRVARDKAEAIQEKIGYPDYIKNDTALDLDYIDVKIDPTKYFENALSGLHISARKNLMKLRQPVDRMRWASAPAVVNAFYSANKNQIMFPAGILQPPFYHDSYPKSLVFGGIAMVIGHELTHGFDDRGRQYDKDGNLKQWWSDSVIEKFKEKAQCFIDQYTNYHVPEAGMNLNGRLTQGENIADNGGLKQAFRAYTRWVEKMQAEERLLPGLQLTHKQLFFLNFAQIWCGTARPENYIAAIRNGRHSPGKFRVIGAVSNSKDFSDAYSCPIGSKMNPEKKCSIW